MSYKASIILVFDCELEVRGIPKLYSHYDYLKANDVYVLFEETLTAYFGKGEFFPNNKLSELDKILNSLQLPKHYAYSQDYYLDQVREAFQKVDKALMVKKLKEI